MGSRPEILALAGLAAACALALGPSAAAERGDDAASAREGVRKGRLVSLESILEWIERRYLGHAIEVELELADDGEPPVYEVEWLTPGNHVVEFEFDARTGELLETEGSGLAEARRP
jgi:uncharacterized membrane protein YkoI